MIKEIHHPSGHNQRSTRILKKRPYKRGNERQDSSDAGERDLRRPLVTETTDPVHNLATEEDIMCAAKSTLLLGNSSDTKSAVVVNGSVARPVA